MSDKQFNPILPFDVTYGEFMDMYDNMTYHRDLSLCDETSIRLESGNILKYFRCATVEPAKIGGEEIAKPIIDKAVEDYRAYSEKRLSDITGTDEPTITPDTPEDDNSSEDEWKADDNDFSSLDTQKLLADR